MRKPWIALLSATALVSNAALAQPYDASASDMRADAGMTAPYSANTTTGVPVLSGGVGMSDRAMIESQQNNYRLKLVFSGQGGAFLSGVVVTLKDKAGATVVSTVTDGPILLINPPAGTYTMTATANGIEKRLTVNAGAGLRTYQIAFPIADDAELTDSHGTYLPKAASPMDSYAPVRD